MITCKTVFQPQSLPHLDALAHAKPLANAVNLYFNSFPDVGKSLRNNIYNFVTISLTV